MSLQLSLDYSPLIGIELIHSHPIDVFHNEVCGFIVLKTSIKFGDWNACLLRDELYCSGFIQDPLRSEAGYHDCASERVDLPFCWPKAALDPRVIDLEVFALSCQPDAVCFAFGVEHLVCDWCHRGIAMVNDAREGNR